jgi:adenylate cyclase
MMPVSVFLLGLAAAAIPLSALALIQRKRLNRLRDLYESQTDNLERLQESCARLAPGNVADQLAAGVDLTGVAERKEATALFADLVGYTRLSESLDAPVLARVLNGYFQHMSDAIADYRGHISTFVGDGLLVYFGALQPNPWQSDDAVHSALAMRKALACYNRQLVREGLPALAFGIGIHRGTGVAGWVGSRERMEYAFVGRTVNVAARVQALTRDFGVDLLITEAVKAALDPRFRLVSMPPARLKGIDQPVNTFSVDGLDDERRPS